MNIRRNLESLEITEEFVKEVRDVMFRHYPIIKFGWTHWTSHKYKMELMSNEMKVLYRCQGEMNQTVEPQELSSLLRNLIDGRMKSQQLKEIVKDLEDWGAYYGSHDFGQFIIVIVSRMEKEIFLFDPNPIMKGEER